jgi:trehalose 6-phosphate phosphatase
VALLSGRARADVRRRLEGVSVKAVVGEHGADDGTRPRARVPDLRSWHRQLARALQGCRGVVLEVKPSSLAVHYRGASDRSRVRHALRTGTALLRGARLVAGKEVLNVLPEAAPDKGTVFARLRAGFGCTHAIYVGDDRTDEDVFACGGPRLLGVRVGRRSDSKASYYLARQVEIDAFLRVLIGLRAGAQSGVASAVTTRAAAPVAPARRRSTRGSGAKIDGQND